MNNKYILVGIILISFLFLLSCGNTNNTSDDDGPKTLEELKDKKVNDPSEYDKCLKEIEENEKKDLTYKYFCCLYCIYRCLFF